MSKSKTYRDLSLEELKAKEFDLRKVLFKLINEKKQASKLEKTHKLGETRRDIARVLTIVAEKENQLNEGAES